MKKYIIGFWYSLPIQLFLLHCRKYQVFLLFWYILFATVGGHFLEDFGSAALFLAPEYLSSVNFISTAIVGMSMGVFIMSWNITTFILHSKLLHFLGTTAQPFLKYCINNALIPLSFLLFYFIKAIQYENKEEYYRWIEIAQLVAGFLGGFLVSILIAFLYFFTTDKGIYYSMVQDFVVANNQSEKEKTDLNAYPAYHEDMRIDCFFSTILHLRRPRNTIHYSQKLLETIFKRHHFAAVYAILLAFIFLIVVGFFSDNILFQLPAAASITILFAILIAVSGAFSLFFRSWSIPLLVIGYLLINTLYETEWADPKNKVFGLQYPSKNERPEYNTQSIEALAADSNIEKDKTAFLQVLNNWKQRQTTQKPTLYIINVSGGGTRSATFAMNTLQRIDSIMYGNLMKQTVLINGASGGMLGAAYFRALYSEKLGGNNQIHIQDKQYVEDISKDLLNPLFSSFVTRDMLGPVQKIEYNGCYYVKDRGYAFEQQLNKNTRGLLEKPLIENLLYEQNGQIPTIIFTPVISKDGKKLLIGTRPFRFLMKPTIANNGKEANADAIDYASFFAKEDPLSCKLSSALRMSATFPYILPNVWLPTNPVVDVMDAGLRDNYGQETSIRFIEAFKDWLQENTNNVVLIEIRDKPLYKIDSPTANNGIIGFFIKPIEFLQNNWFNIQNYHQQEQLLHFSDWYGSHFKKICFQYIHGKKATPAGLSFHLTAAEKKDIAASLDDSTNIMAIQELKTIINN